MLQPSVLIDQVRNVAFAYFGVPGPKQKAAWLDRWSERDALPQLIRMRLTLANGAQAPDLIWLHGLPRPHNHDVDPSPLFATEGHRQRAHSRRCGRRCMALVDRRIGSLRPIEYGSVSPAAEAVCLIIDAEEDNPIEETGDGRRSLGRLDVDTPRDRRTIARLPRARRRASADRHPARTRHALRTTASLPLAAERNLAQVIGFEFERLVPFKQSEVYFAYRVTARDKAMQTIAVELTIVPHAKLAKIAAALPGLGFQAEEIDQSPTRRRCADDHPYRERKSYYAQSEQPLDQSWPRRHRDHARIACAASRSGGIPQRSAVSTRKSKCAPPGRGERHTAEADRRREPRPAVPHRS